MNLTKHKTQSVQEKKTDGFNKKTTPTIFIAVCIFCFIAGLSATIYFYYSMCCDMEMPGGWTMSMMWMRMPGQTWLLSGLVFLIMWVSMMVAMMMPSALPMFLKAGRQGTSLFYMLPGYFVVWLAAGVVIFIVEAVFASMAMQSFVLSHAVPFLIGGSLMTAGVVQFTPWKMKRLMCCRSPLGCAYSSLSNETGFQTGCRQGLACCTCCAAPMTMQLALGIMNPWAMIAVAAIIAAEKLLPRPQITARLAGIAAIIAGVVTIIF